MSSIFFPFPLPLNKKQWAYLIIPQCVLAGIIDGGANFGIAYAMYHNQKSVRMWVFKENTIAGDLGVTCLIQTAVSMIITSTLVHTDLHSTAIAPLPFVYPHVSHLPDPATLFKRKDTSTDPSDPEKALAPAATASGPASYEGKKGFKYYWLMLVRFIFEGSENNILLERAPVRTWLKRLVWTAVQGLGIGIFFGFPLWCLAVLILGPIYGNGNLGNKWAPQVIKLVYALILGVITNPLIAILALGSQAEHHLIPLPSPPADAPVTNSTLLTPGSPSMGSRHRRPSFTANTSYLTVPPVTPPPRNAHSPSSSTGLPSGQPLPSTSPTGVGLVRPRAMTNASETVSLYSLGGTGGRAQRANRPRANSRASFIGSYLGSSGQEDGTPSEGPARLGAPLTTPFGEFGHDQTRAIGSGLTPGSDPMAPPHSLLIPGKLMTRDRSHSGASFNTIGSYIPTGTILSGEGPLTPGVGVSRVMQLQNSQELEAPRESLELSPVERSNPVLEDTKK